MDNWDNGQIFSCVAVASKFLSPIITIHQIEVSVLCIIIERNLKKEINKGAGAIKGQEQLEMITTDKETDERNWFLIRWSCVNMKQPKTNRGIVVPTSIEINCVNVFFCPIIIIVMVVYHRYKSDYFWFCVGILLLKRIIRCAIRKPLLAMKIYRVKAYLLLLALVIICGCNFWR